MEIFLHDNELKDKLFSCIGVNSYAEGYTGEAMNSSFQGIFKFNLFKILKNQF